MSIEQSTYNTESVSFDPVTDGSEVCGETCARGFSVIQGARSVVFARRHGVYAESSTTTQPILESLDVITLPIEGNQVINDSQYSDDLLLGCSDKDFEKKLQEIQAKSQNKNNSRNKVTGEIALPEPGAFGRHTPPGYIGESARSFGVSNDFFSLFGKLLFERIANDPRWASLSTEDQSVLSLAYEATEESNPNMRKSRIAFLFDIPNDEVDVHITRAIMRAEALLVSEN